MTNEEAISLISKNKSVFKYDTEMTKALNLAINALKKRPQGEWGKWVITEIQCPNCLEYFQTDCYSTEELKKCPNCGAKMKEGAE